MKRFIISLLIAASLLASCTTDNEYSNKQYAPIVEN